MNLLLFRYHSQVEDGKVVGLDDVFGSATSTKRFEFVSFMCMLVINVCN